MNHQRMVGKINQKRRQLVSSIRHYVRAQKELWQQVPYLVLQVQGRGGFVTDYYRAYAMGCWKTSEPSVYVDCATGELVYLPVELEDGRFALPNIVQDHLVIKLDPKELNATKVIARLMEQQKVKNLSIDHFATSEHRTPNGWRQAEKKKYRVHKKYRRVAA